MNNKYRININWDLNGPRFVYDVIIDLFDELNKSLKTPLMQESKSDEEVQKILDNPEGITIEELQVINTWDLTDEKLRRKVRSKLDWAYRELSTRLNRLITYRNGMPNRSQERNDNIDNKNRELKNTMISQYQVIESLVEDYEKKEKSSENKSKKNLLTYIQKVYSGALNEITENLFSMATEDTERAKIFPFEEQEAFKNKLAELQEKIWSIVEKSKQNRSNQQIQGLERRITQLQDLNQQLQQQLGNKEAKRGNKIEEENEAKKKIQTELDRFSKIKIKEIGDEEVTELISKFEEMRNWLSTGNKGQKKAVIGKYSELKEVVDKLNLEDFRRDWKRTINEELRDKDSQIEKERLVLSNYHLQAEYADFAITLWKKASEEEIDEFGERTLTHIARQREKLFHLIRVIKKGRNLITSGKKDVKQAEKILNYLEIEEEMAEETEDRVFYNKIIEVNRLKDDLKNLIETQPQVEQFTK